MTASVVVDSRSPRLLSAIIAEKLERYYAGILVELDRVMGLYGRS